ncbi:MAG: hypothetical protein ABH859_07165 [Pseudomonadota bacterium]
MLSIGEYGTNPAALQQTAPVVATGTSPWVQMPPAPQTRLNLSLNETNSHGYLQGQQTNQQIAMGLNATGGLMDSITNIYGTYAQLEVMNAYYSAINNNIDASREIASAQISLQREALYQQTEMQRQQNTHEQTLARIERNMHIAITQIEQDGMTNRAEILGTADSYFRGNPVA